MEEIIIDVALDGTYKVEAKGFKGKQCKELTAPIEQALGTVEHVEHKPEFRVAAEGNAERQKERNR